MEIKPSKFVCVIRMTSFVVHEYDINNIYTITQKPAS